MVFAAHDPTLDREAALKILSETYSADEVRIAAFEEEARITASFSHPHVVRVLKTGRAFGRFYIAMELVPGGHFEHQIKERGKIPEVEMLPLAIQVAQGLRAAHAAGLIHRDVKPGNILLDAEGNAKLVDFGLALVTQGGQATATELWATPYYVPPETIEGSSEDFRSDIYAFGATLYHALTGSPSCGELTMATELLREAKKNVVPCGVAGPMLSADTCAIIDRAMAYEPAARFGSYDEMIGQLEASLVRLKTGAKSAGEVFQESSRRQVGYRKTVLGLAGIIAVCAIALVVFATALLKKKRPQAVLPNLAPPSTQELATPAEDTSTVSISKTYREAREALTARNFESAAALFTTLSENPAVQEPTRTWAGVEAIAAAYLKGDPALARARAETSLKRVDRNSPVTEGLRRVLGELSMLTPISLDLATGQPTSSAQVMGWMLAGLKNWEQGLPAAAVPFFESAAAAKPAMEDGWLVSYQKLARDYLADYQLLTTHAYQPFPNDRKACAEAISSLEAALQNLKTQGRARYNIRALQLDLTRHAKFLDLPKPPPPPLAAAAVDLPSVMAILAGHARDCDFASATAYLRALTGEPAGASRASLLTMVEYAENFLTDLQHDLTTSSATLPLSLKSGEPIRKLSVDALGTLICTDALGKETQTTWGAFTADSLISLHRALVKKPTSEPERRRRHLCAIAFDWLAGNRQRALTAVATLAQASPTFKQQWDSIASGLPAGVP